MNDNKHIQISMSSNNIDDIQLERISHDTTSKGVKKLVPTSRKADLANIMRHLHLLTLLPPQHLSDMITLSKGRFPKTNARPGPPVAAVPTVPCDDYGVGVFLAALPHESSGTFRELTLTFCLLLSYPCVLERHQYEDIFLDPGTVACALPRTVSSKLGSLSRLPFRRNSSRSL